MFEFFPTRKNRQRGLSEDPAALRVSVGRGKSLKTELIDYTLIDETLHEWMEEAPGIVAKESAPTRNESVPERDRVVEAAIKRGFITEDDMAVWARRAGGNPISTWRQVVRLSPERTQQSERLSSEVYGFRPVLICQMSTLVLADLLTCRVSPLLWQQMFELGVAPVVEHGESPTLDGRITCVSRDPASRKIRGFIEQLSAFRADLSYADGSVVDTMMNMMAQHVPAIGASVYVNRPRMQRIESIPTTRKAA